MKQLYILALVPLVMLAPASPLPAKDKQQWTYDGRVFDSYEACKKAKKDSKKKGAIVGAAGGAATALIFGGNVGEAALAAGAGAAAGAIIGKNAKKC